MSGGQSGASKPAAAIGVLVVVLLLGVGGAAVAKVGPFAPSGSTPASGGQAARLTKPSDPKQAVIDAVGRTADFKDVKYTATFTYTSATIPSINSESQVSATKSPVMVDTRNTSSTGNTFESILNGANKVFCTMPGGGPAQRFPNQAVAADAADPFNGLLQNGNNWKFLDDVDLNGRNAWHVMGDMPLTVASPNPNNIKVNVSTAEVWINSQSGKIEKRLDHEIGTENAVKYERSSTDTGFVYNSGVTITPCQ